MVTLWHLGGTARQNRIFLWDITWLWDPLWQEGSLEFLTRSVWPLVLGYVQVGDSLTFEGNQQQGWSSLPPSDCLTVAFLITYLWPHWKQGGDSLTFESNQQQGWSSLPQRDCLTGTLVITYLWPQWRQGTRLRLPLVILSYDAKTLLHSLIDVPRVPTLSIALQAFILQRRLLTCHWLHPWITCSDGFSFISYGRVFRVKSLRDQVDSKNYNQANTLQGNCKAVCCH
jgi:hypothetical protein